MLTAPRRILSPASVTLLLLAGGYANLAHGGRGVLVDTVRPERRHLVSVVSLDATIEPVNTIVIGAPAVGRVSEVAVKAGDHVEAGQLLLRLDNTEASAQLDAAASALGAIDAERRAALARLDRAVTQLRVASARQGRAKRLQDAGLIAQADLDAAGAVWKLATSDVRFAELKVAEHRERGARQRHVVASLRHALEVLWIRAPTAGRVAEVRVAPGNMVVPAVRPDLGGALLVMHDDSRLQATAHVDGSALPALAVGQAAWLTLAAFPGERVAGSVLSLGLAPVADVDGTGEPRFRVVIAVSETRSARPGQTGTVTIVTAERHNVPAIPRHIVSRDPATGVPAVFVVDHGRARLTPVALGIADTTHVEVLWGVPDDVVLVAGPLATARRLENGDRLRAR